ncbi:2-dehydro-3-deoxyphosphogluconate aldolase/4-hydroxy-2-oxoglutarate aldolase [Firmicutes bacterium M10-2]|nr:2-dehydro-3-deoxyphosphogluconate aldolase/4-hydroxy-2-oxoglutarate aldolase [Firmicutes bacterium M10-2]
MTNKQETLNALKEEKLIFIFKTQRIEDDDLLRAVQAVVSGGGRFIELTYDQPTGQACVRALKLLKEHFGNQIILGTGTILDEQECQNAIEAGSEYIVAPNLSREVSQLCLKYDLMYMPGVFTGTEVVNAWKWGADVLKLFPGCEISLDYAQTLMGVIPVLPYFAVCKMDEEMFEKCLKIGYIGAGISRAINNCELIASKNFSEIEQRTRRFVKIASEV